MVQTLYARSVLLLTLFLVTTVFSQIPKYKPWAQRAQEIQARLPQGKKFLPLAPRKSRKKELSGPHLVSQIEPLPFSGNNYVVTLTTDSNPTIPGELRFAINQSNAAVIPPNTANYITFAIPGTGPFTIQPDPTQPNFTLFQPVFINGYSQLGATQNSGSTPGTDANLLIELKGSTFTNLTNAFNSLYGLDFEPGSDGSVVQGIVFNEWSIAGILIDELSDVGVGGCFFGTDVSGTVPDANGCSIFLFGADSAQIGSTDPIDKNLFGANFVGPFDFGFNLLDVFSTSTAIVGNLCGTDRTGMQSLNTSFGGIEAEETFGDLIANNIISGNYSFGIFFIACASTTIQNNLIGTNANGNEAVANTMGIIVATFPGFPPTTDTLISGNTVSGNIGGIEIGETNTSGVSGTVIQGNFIGTTSNGTGNLGNQRGGITIINDGNTIGGSTPAARNIIAANGSFGVLISANGTLVQGNYIGLDINGNPLGNFGDGIQVGLSAFTGSATNTTIQNNVISSNTGNGISIKSGSTDTIIEGNILGEDPTGTQPRPNGQEGILISSSSQSSISNNTIAFNCSGIQVGLNACDATSNDNSILSNSIFANKKLGIDLHKKIQQSRV